MYLSYSDEYPDAEVNDGVFKTGKIKIAPPHDEGRFSLEWWSFAVLSKIHCSLNIAYYFKNESPISLNSDPDNIFDIPTHINGFSSLKRMDTQIARTNKVENAKLKYMNMIEMIHNRVDEISML